MKRILFVDDEPNVLESLRDALRPRRREWTMAFAPGGEAALEALAEHHYDVVVSDMRMPGMDGAALLGHVREAQRDSVRIIHSGYAVEAVAYHDDPLKAVDPVLDAVAVVHIADSLVSEVTDGTACWIASWWNTSASPGSSTSGGRSPPGSPTRTRGSRRPPPAAAGNAPAPRAAPRRCTAC